MWWRSERCDGFRFPFAVSEKDWAGSLAAVFLVILLDDRRRGME
jgi:hypothetical protein